MQIALVMTVIGPDRPGIVEKVARLVAEHGGNWLESRMCRLGGEFAGILRIQLPSNAESKLVIELCKLQAEQLSVVVRPDQAEVPLTPERSVALEVVGHDRPGIVRAITAVLTRHLVNVEELETERASAPISGEPLFRAKALLKLPESCNLEVLRGDLEKAAEDLTVEVTVAEEQRA